MLFSPPWRPKAAAASTYPPAPPGGTTSHQAAPPAPSPDSSSQLPGACSNLLRGALECARALNSHCVAHEVGTVHGSTQRYYSLIRAAGQVYPGGSQRLGPRAVGQLPAAVPAAVKTSTKSYKVFLITRSCWNDRNVDSINNLVLAEVLCRPQGSAPGRLNGC